MESFKLYKQRFENYLKLKGVSKDKKLCHQIFINSIGPTYFKLLVSLVSPKTIDDVECDELMMIIVKHLCPKRNTLVLQHRFLSSFQSDEQSIAEYVAILRRDIFDCKFTCTCKADVSDMFLRAQFIRGITDNTIWEQLLQASDTDFSQIYEKALSLEASKIDSRELNFKTPSQTDVNKIQTRYSRQKPKSKSRQTHRSKSKVNFKQLGIDHLCVRCGKDNHKSAECQTNTKN